MDPVHHQISAFLRGQSVSRAAPVLVGVSGGADSIALLHALLALGQRVVVAHVHHGLRGEQADADLHFVRERARSLGVSCFAERVDAARRDGRSPEARARELRYAALERVRVWQRCAWLATAHTADDQAETLLLRSIRGTGPGGLGGIVPADPERRLLRPLLRVRRQALRSYLKARGLSWRDDSSNADRGVPRNRLRLDVLPVLESIHPGAGARLAELAEAARETESWLEREVERVLRSGIEPGEGGLWIDRSALCAAPAPIRKRALMRLLCRSGLQERISRLHLARIERFLGDSSAGKRLSLPLGATLLSDGAELWLGRDPGPRYPGPFRASLRPPEPLERPERGLRLVWSALPSRGRDSDGLCVPARLSARLTARNPRPDDCIQPEGTSRSQLLKDLFARARWSRRARERALLIALDDEPLWVVGLARARLPRSGASAGWELRAERLSATRGTC